MKNAPNRMIGWPTKGDMVARKPLTDQEEKFCELVINGMKQTDALISSGIMPADSEFKVLKNKAGSLMATARVRRYMIENAKVIKVMTSRDYDIVRTHMYEIAMGTAVRKCKKLDKEGNVVEYEDSPSFRDQISAAGWLSADLKMRNEKEGRTPAQEIILKDIDEIEQKANALVDKYSYRRIVQDGRTTRSIMQLDKAAEEYDVVDVEVEDVQSFRVSTKGDA